MAQAIFGRYLSPEKRGLAFSLYGVTGIVAPSIGPLAVGSQTNIWRWIFYIKLPVGLIAFCCVLQTDRDPDIYAQLGTRAPRGLYRGRGCWPSELARCRFC